MTDGNLDKFNLLTFMERQVFPAKGADLHWFPDTFPGVLQFAGLFGGVGHFVVHGDLQV